MHLFTNNLHSIKRIVLNSLYLWEEAVEGGAGEGSAEGGPRRQQTAGLAGEKVAEPGVGR